MDAAKAWGKPPWEFVGGSSVIWYFRFKVLRDLEGEAAEIKKQQAEQMAFLHGM